MMHRKVILIIDPSAESCRELKQSIETHETLVEVLEAVNADQTRYILKKRIPDIVFLEVEMPLPTGLALITALQEAAPGCRIVVLTANESEECRQAALDQGVEAVYFKELTTGIRRIDLIHNLIRR